jgi:hypothetical protein
MTVRFQLASALILGLLLLPVGLRAQQTGDDPNTTAQKRTVIDIRNVGSAMWSWYHDQKRSAASSPKPGAESPAWSVDLTRVPVISREDLAAVLVPKYIAAIPAEDGWGQPYEFRLNVQDPNAAEAMAVRSAGRDGVLSDGNYKVSAFKADDFDQDIAWMDGFFMRWPEKPQEANQSPTMRTITDIRNVGTAMFHWYKDELAPKRSEEAHRQAERQSKEPSVDVASIPVISREKLAALLVPKYIERIPEQDGWSHTYEYRLETRNPNAVTVMAIRSPGQDGYSGTVYKIGAFPAGARQDIAWVDGYFARWPEK